MGKRKKPTKQKVEQTLIDVVIITGGRWDMLRKCLKALEAQIDAPKFEVVLIDNNTDNKERIHNKEIFETPIVTRSKRLTNELGFPAANNEGARMGTAPLILFLNDDVELKPDAINMLARTLDDESIGVVGAKLTFPENSHSGPAGKIQHIGMAMDIKGDVVHPLIGWSADNPKCCISRDTFAVTGACMMTRRNLFKQAGGFYEGYGLGTYEEVDFQMSVQAKGKRVFINTEAQGTHYTGATVEKKQRGFPLQHNAGIFRARWAQSGLFRWDNYTYY